MEPVLLTPWLAPHVRVAILTSSAGQRHSTRGLLHAPQGTAHTHGVGLAVVSGVQCAEWPGRGERRAEMTTTQCSFSEDPRTRCPNTRLQQVGRPAASCWWRGIRPSRSLYVEDTGFPSRAQEGVWRPTVSLTHVNECMFSAQLALTCPMHKLWP